MRGEGSPQALPGGLLRGHEQDPRRVDVQAVHHAAAKPALSDAVDPLAEARPLRRQRAQHGAPLVRTQRMDRRAGGLVDGQPAFALCEHRHPELCVGRRSLVLRAAEAPHHDLQPGVQQEPLRARAERSSRLGGPRGGELDPPGREQPAHLAPRERELPCEEGVEAAARIVLGDDQPAIRRVSRLGRRSPGAGIGAVGSDVGGLHRGAGYCESRAGHRPRRPSDSPPRPGLGTLPGDAARQRTDRGRPSRSGTSAPADAGGGLREHRDYGPAALVSTRLSARGPSQGAAGSRSPRPSVSRRHPPPTRGCGEPITPRRSRSRVSRAPSRSRPHGPGSERRARERAR